MCINRQYIENMTNMIVTINVMPYATEWQVNSAQRQAKRRLGVGVDIEIAG